MLRRAGIALILCLILAACAPSADNIRQTQVPLTQTAEWSVKDQHVQCLFSVQQKALDLEGFSTNCDTDDCRSKTAAQLKSLADDLPATCPPPLDCARPTQEALGREIIDLASWALGPNRTDNPAEQDQEAQALLDQTRASSDNFYNTLNQSCLRRY